MDREDAVHMYHEILLSHKKEWHHAICSNMDIPRNCDMEWIKSDRERQISCDTAYMGNLKKKNQVHMYLFTKQKQTHRCKKQTYGY